MLLIKFLETFKEDIMKHSWKCKKQVLLVNML